MRIRVSGKDARSKGWMRAGDRNPSSASQPADGEAAGGWDDASDEEAPPVDRRMHRYLLSLPERVVRSAAALSAGLLREVGDVTLPGPLRRSKLYATMVEAALRFLIEEVGQVEGAYPPEGKLSEDFAFRRAAGNGLELVGILAFRASPVWVMAALADVSGSGRRLIQEIAECLKREGLLESNREFKSVDHILDGLEKTSGRVADTINTPPLDVQALRNEWSEIRQDIRRIPPSNLPSSERLWTQWRDLQAVAAKENRSLFQVSAVMALSAVGRLPEDLRWLSRSAKVAGKRTGEIFAGALLDDYAKTLSEIRETGFLAYWKRQFRPYLKAAASQFSRRRSTLTERALERREAWGQFSL